MGLKGKELSKEVASVENFCVDMGTAKCPCILMESGQCYACDMVRSGRCNCGINWKGVCPYTEYVLNNKVATREAEIRNFVIAEVDCYSPTLTVITIRTPMAFGEKCKRIGSFLMIKWKNWYMPISVLQVEEDYDAQEAHIMLGINATGPKTIGLLKDALVGGTIAVKGPFFSGLINSHKYNKDALNIVVAKGVALMPLINIKERIGNGLVNFYIDESKLPKAFREKYLKDIQYESICLDSEMEDVVRKVAEGYSFAVNHTKIKPNIFLMVSPYYKEKICKEIMDFVDEIIFPNHSNMCCGEGYCGSCSYTDEKGNTVRRCKCIDK